MKRGGEVNYSGMTEFLEQFQRESGLKVVIKDFVGLFEMEQDLFRAVQNFYIHNTPFCMAIKESQRLWGYCMLEKKMIYQRLLREPVPFFGFCYAGVGEYILPVLHEGMVIAALTIGGFPLEPEVFEKKIASLTKRNGLDEKRLSRAYHDSIIQYKVDLEPHMKKLEIIVEYLSLIYQGTRGKEKQGMQNKEMSISRTYILSHAMEYIKLHHKEEVKLEELAKFCHCSKSYISHQFKCYTKMTVKTYMNQLRINSAKELMKSEKSITEIAFLVGFKDSNYFSKVFKQLEQTTPTAYRSHFGEVIK